MLYEKEPVQNPYLIPGNVVTSDVLAQYLTRLEETYSDPYRIHAMNEEFTGINRGRNDYERVLFGIEGLFTYASLLPAKGVIDIGAGTTKGISDISKASYGGGFEYLATVLRLRQEIESNLGTSRTLVTPVERLEGVADSSCAVALGVHSIGYSIDPELAMRQIDRVLTPGGT